MIQESDWLASWQVNFEEAPPVLDAWISRAGHVAGHARVTITGSVAELNDLLVYERARLPLESLVRLLGLRGHENYRGQGLGTKLLNEILANLRGRGVATMEGVIPGDSARLARWFRAAGFNVNDESGRIRRLIR
jgi:GNAT superfamily N-acetyltransferase